MDRIHTLHMHGISDRDESGMSIPNAAAICGVADGRASSAGAG
jgi:hypothetical protein